MKNFFKARIVQMFGIIALAAVMVFSMAACNNGGGGGGGGSPTTTPPPNTGGGDTWAILEDTTWIKEGQTAFPKIRYSDMGGPGQYCYNDKGQQVGSNGQITFDGNSVKAGGKLSYNFELKDGNTKMIISNFEKWLIHEDNTATDGGMSGTYTKR